MTPYTQPHHEILASRPLHYDIAYGGRELEGECVFLEYLSRTLGRGRLDSFVELCCGPGFHLHWLADHGVVTYGVDSSPEMIAYAEEKARLRHERLAADARQAGRAGASEERDRPGAFVLADPRDFALPEAVDLAFCPNHALRYMLRNEDVIAHLVTVAKNLGRGGLYVLEVEHPRVLLGSASQQTVAWEAERDGIRVAVRCGPGRNALDPITQVRDLAIVLEIYEGGRKEVLEDAAPVRAFTHQELRALVKLSGVFDWVATFGDLSIAQPFDMSDHSRCMVPVLRCSV